MTREEAIAGLQGIVDGLLRGKTPLRVLEAGCGSAGHLRLPAPRHVVGIDISAKQLERNASLDVKIQADLQSYDLPKDAFDLVVCWEVLEHLPHPERAVDKLVAATAPGGIVVLALPNVYSVKGLVTKFTPHWFHVAFYRHVYGVKDAGRDDRAPFETFLRLSISAPAIRRAAAKHGLRVVHFAGHDVAAYVRRTNRPASLVYDVTRGLARVLSLGALGDSDFIIVLQRQGRDEAPLERAA